MEFFSQSVLKEFNIKKQTLQSSIEALFKSELIDKNDDKYFILIEPLSFGLKDWFKSYFCFII